MELNTRETGKTISNMGMEKKLGLMKQCTKDSIKMGRNTERVNFYGKMIVVTREIFYKITSMVSANMYGTTGEYMRVSGETTKCKARESSLGLMVDDIKASIRMIRRKALEYLPSEMAESMKENGKTENNMVMESSKKKLSSGRNLGRWGTS